MIAYMFGQESLLMIHDASEGLCLDTQDYTCTTMIFMLIERENPILFVLEKVSDFLTRHETHLSHFRNLLNNEFY